MDARRKLLQFEQKEHEFLDELQEAQGLLTSKEAECSRLAKDLGSAQVREAQAEAKCLQEIRRVEQQFSVKVANYENEVCPWYVVINRGLLFLLQYTGTLINSIFAGFSVDMNLASLYSPTERARVILM